MQAPRPDRNYIGSDLFAYVFPELGPLAVAGTDQDQIIIQDDSDFEMLALMYHFSLTNAAFVENTRPIPNWTVQITDTGSGATLFNNPIPLSSIAAHGENGAIRQLPVSRLFRRNATVQVTVVNFDAAVTTGLLRLSMVGQKLYLGGDR